MPSPFPDPIIQPHEIHFDRSAIVEAIKTRALDNGYKYGIFHTDIGKYNSISMSCRRPKCDHSILVRRMLSDGDYWTLKVINSSHNHRPQRLIKCLADFPPAIVRLVLRETHWDAKQIRAIIAQHTKTPVTNKGLGALKRKWDACSRPCHNEIDGLDLPPTNITALMAEEADVKPSNPNLKRSRRAPHDAGGDGDPEVIIISDSDESDPETTNEGDEDDNDHRDDDDGDDSDYKGNDSSDVEYSHHRPPKRHRTGPGTSNVTTRAVLSNATTSAAATARTTHIDPGSRPESTSPQEPETIVHEKPQVFSRTNATPQAHEIPRPPTPQETSTQNENHHHQLNNTEDETSIAQPTRAEYLQAARARTQKQLEMIEEEILIESQMEELEKKRNALRAKREAMKRGG